MNLYILLFICSFLLLGFLFVLRRGSIKKFVQKSWIERLETVARDNQNFWMTQVLYPLGKRVRKELILLENEQKTRGSVLNISENGEWSSPADLLKYPYIKRLFKKLIPQITSYSRILGVEPKYLTLSAWASISREGPEISKELQSDALFAGCYFLDGGDEKESGALSFYKKGSKDSIFAKLIPYPGDLILYPSDMSQKIEAYQEKQGRVAIYFNVHFGTRKKSWFLSKVQGPEVEPDSEPDYELKAERNKPKDKKANTLKPMLLHISKIKKTIFK